MPALPYIAICDEIIIDLYPKHYNTKYTEIGKQINILFQIFYSRNLEVISDNCRAEILPFDVLSKASAVSLTTSVVF